MESWIVIFLGVVFYWLMIETNWLRVRLPHGVVESESDALSAVLAIVPMLIFIGLISSALRTGFGGIKKIGYSIKAHEEFMKSLWKIYGRKQPSTIIAN